jgi:hypothetical protein
VPLPIIAEPEPPEPEENLTDDAHELSDKPAKRHNAIYFKYFIILKTEITKTQNYVFFL